MEFTFQPIAYIRNESQEFYQVPYQVGILPEMTSVIEFESGQNFEAALSDLEGFDRIWVVFIFDKSITWKPKIQPPRGDKKVGVFASRSPHRPNPIGLSAVELVKIEGLKLYIRNHDFLDGTPVLDLKPYIPEVDCYPNSSNGWLSDIENTICYDLEILDEVQHKFDFLRDECGYDLFSLAEVNLRTNPLPRSNNRIKMVGDSLYTMAVKTWRLTYALEDNFIKLTRVSSGYDIDTIEGRTQSKWDDVWIHKRFLERFGE